MSAALDRIHALLDEVKAEFEKLFGHADTEVQTVVKAAAERVDEAKSTLEAVAPKLVGEAEQDAADVVKTAETEGVMPAEQEAVKDGTELVVDAGHDIAAAVEGSDKPAPAEQPPSA